MGKKGKKDDKAQPEDVFDPLLVETRQAATVVQLLNSQEEDVLAKACEAIYRFINKCDENKKTLLELEVHEPLLRLVRHEDRIVRRNACMALGVLANHPDARRLLRKREETIPSMVHLLGVEEDMVMHEFAALCLLEMANDFTGKILINENDGMEPLIRFLSAPDPDLQKNAVETIALMLMDYSCRTSFRELSGLAPLLELLRSDFPVIQHMALVGLERATLDADSRVALRELEATAKLIDFVGRPEFSDLHVFAVVVLANCLEDTETMELIKENGGLQKLMAFITDTIPPEDEDSKKGGATASKGKDKGASRAGKKGKGGEEVKRKSGKGAPHDDDKKRSETEPIIPTLPEVKEHAAKAIARAAKNMENRKLLHEAEVEKMLIHLLAHEEGGVQIAAANALGVMAEFLTARNSITTWDGIEPLVKLLRSEVPAVREASAMCLANLTAGVGGERGNRAAQGRGGGGGSAPPSVADIVRHGGIEPLITMLEDECDMAIANAAVTLTNMSTEEQTRSEIQQAGIVPALIPGLSSPSTVVQSKVSFAISAFVNDAETRASFRDNGGVDPLVALLTSGDAAVRRDSSWALAVIATDPNIASDVTANGVLEILQEIQLSNTRKNAFTGVAMRKIMDNNLSAKYALTGFLNTTDSITDGFYDMGCMREGSKVLPLEDLVQVPVNARRAIILVNAQPQKPETPPPSDELLEKTSKSSVSGRNSRTGRDKTTRSRIHREKEEKNHHKEEEAKAPAKELVAKEVNEDGIAVSQPPPVFQPPGDNILVTLVDDVMEKINPLPSTRDQVVALAQFVAEKMGGHIDRGQVANFSWELAISQIKFELKSNIIPIGMIKSGIHYHRALLFKALGDRIAIGCSLIRGEYNRAWNEVLLADDVDTMTGIPSFPLKTYIVDLIHQPGRLMRSDTPDAVSYQKL